MTKRRWLGKARILVLACIAVGGAPRAYACGAGGAGSPSNGLIAVLAAGAAVGAAVGAADLSFSVYDGVKATRGERPGRGAAIAEIALTAPQVVLGALYVGSGEAGPAGLVLALWPTVLLTHGIWEVATGAPRRKVETGDAPRRQPRWQERMSLAPTLVSDGTEVGTGVAVGGRF